MSAFRTVARLSVAAALVAACADGSAPTDPSFDAILSLAKDQPPAAQKALAAARAATARFHRVEVAQAAGYAPMGGCVAVPGVGGMGVHYVNVEAVGNPALDPEKPEVLVYEPQANGQMRLVAVEYLGIQAMYPSRPSLFGAAFEDGPMLPGPDGKPTATYALHAWVWQNNPAGVLAAFNPTVSCANAPAPAAADVAAHAHH